MARTTAEIAAEAEALRDADQEVIEQEEEREEESTVDDSPPGFLSYEDYVASGKDPKRYKGEEAYKETHGYIQEIKGLKKEVKTISKSVAETMETWQSKERQKIKAQLESELKQQKEDGLVDEALQTKEQLDQIKADEKRGPQLPPVIVDYIADNPLIDIDSESFNKDFFEDFKLVYDSTITKLTNGTGMGLSDRQIQRALNSAYTEAKDLNPELFPPTSSPRNERTGPGRVQAKSGEGKGQSIEVRLKNMKFGDNRNPDDNPNPAYSTYIKLKETNVKAAERFARGILGDA